MGLNLTDRQKQALLALNDNDVVDVLYGGAKGGGKSWFLCCWVYWWCKEIIAQRGLEPARNVPHIGWMGRKQGIDFTATTLQTWQEMTDVIPIEDYEIKGASEKHPKHIRIANAVAVDFGGLERQEDKNKFNSAEYVFIAIDQAEETTQDDISVLRATRRMKLKGKPFHYKGLFTANPAQCWLKEEFIDEKTAKPKNRFVQALPSDNPNLPSGYIDTLKDSFSYRPDLLNAYLYGSWDALATPNQVIDARWLYAAQERADKYPVKRYLVCDPARFGDDDTVIFLMADGDIEEKVIMPYCRTTDISNKLAQMSRHNDDCMCIVESVGADVGSGVIDELVQLGVDTLQYNPAGAASDKDKYVNCRAEAWDTAARCLAEGVMKGSNVQIVLKNLYIELQRQLCAPRYDFRGTKLLIEEKSSIKERLGRSPDHADTYVMALWAWPKVESRRRIRAKKAEYAHLSEKYASPFNV